MGYFPYAFFRILHALMQLIINNNNNLLQKQNGRCNANRLTNITLQQIMYLHSVASHHIRKNIPNKSRWYIKKFVFRAVSFKCDKLHIIIWDSYTSGIINNRYYRLHNFNVQRNPSSSLEDEKWPLHRASGQKTHERTRCL